MSNVSQKERATQDRVVTLLTDEHKLGFQYLGDWTHRPDNRNIEEALLSKWLEKQGHDDSVISKAIHQLKQAAALGENRKLYDLNKDVYGLLRYGVKVTPATGDKKQTVHLIDWKKPENNVFAVAEEVSIKGQLKKRPDVVLYVNGIALAVLELKNSRSDISKGIYQNLQNQRADFIRNFFSTVQIVMAGNDSQGLRYGTIETPAKYYLNWKEENPDFDAKLHDRSQRYLSSSNCGLANNLLDCALLRLCNKERFLEILHDFIVFDSGAKKLCRHNQYFGVKAAQQRVRDKQNGIIWHTQGSGKSLTMVWLAKWIRENITDARVLIITDRTELDEQIEKVFKGVNEEIYRTSSGADLLETLNKPNPWLVCSLVHKFSSGEGESLNEFLDQLQNKLPTNFSPKGNLYVFVDECHRTQSGKLHSAMTAILPDATFIGFTGTPLLKADKKRSVEVFGSYIHTYKFDEAVADGVVLDLRYEARDIDQYITSPKKVDQWFEAKTKGLSDMAVVQLKKKWGTMQQVLSSQSRLRQIVDDIMMDMATKPRLADGRGNAMLVCSSIYQACKVYEMFNQTDLKGKCAIITSYKPQPSDVQGEETGEGLTEKLHQYEIYRKMLARFFNTTEDKAMNRVEEFETKVKERFINEPAQMRLLIVVDKLLTGFDAPSCTYLYIDKQMRDHALFQAICRVNRLDGDDKEYGSIVDYKDLFNSLEESISAYTHGALEGFDEEDVAGLLTNRLEKAAERLDETREAIKALCEPVMRPRDDQDYIRYFCGDPSNPLDLKETEGRRLTLYQTVAAFLRAYANLANEMPEAGYSALETEEIKAETRHYEHARQIVKLAASDYVDLKSYEPAMRHLFDSYIRAQDSEIVGEFGEMGLLELIVKKGPEALEGTPGLPKNPAAVAETIENNVRKVIIDESPVNPKYYERMSELLDALIKQRREDAISYREYLEKIRELAAKVTQPAGADGGYPPTLNTSAKRALYDNLGQDEDFAILLDATVKAYKTDGWVGNLMKERALARVVREKAANRDLDLEELMELLKNQDEYR